MPTLAHLNTVCTVMAVTALGLFSPDARSESPRSDPLSLFPESKAPTFYEKKSELVVRRQFQGGARNSRWHPEVDEKSVFHARLQHKSVEERGWQIGIGRGGQMYSNSGTPWTGTRISLWDRATHKGIGRMVVVVAGLVGGKGTHLRPRCLPPLHPATMHTPQHRGRPRKPPQE